MLPLKAWRWWSMLKMQLVTKRSILESRLFYNFAYSRLKGLLSKFDNWWKTTMLRVGLQYWSVHNWFSIFYKTNKGFELVIFNSGVHSDFFIQISVHCRQDMVLELLSWQFYAFITSLTCDFLLLKLWVVVCFWPFFSSFYIIMSTGRKKGYCWYAGAGDCLNFKILI